MCGKRKSELIISILNLCLINVGLVSSAASLMLWPPSEHGQQEMQVGLSENGQQEAGKQEAGKQEAAVLTILAISSAVSLLVAILLICRTAVRVSYNAVTYLHFPIMF